MSQLAIGWDCGRLRFICRKRAAPGSESNCSMPLVNSHPGRRRGPPPRGSGPRSPGGRVVGGHRGSVSRPSRRAAPTGLGSSRGSNPGSREAGDPGRGGPSRYPRARDSRRGPSRGADRPGWPKGMWCRPGPGRPSPRAEPRPGRLRRRRGPPVAGNVSTSSWRATNCLSLKNMTAHHVRFTVSHRTIDH